MQQHSLLSVLCVAFLAARAWAGDDGVIEINSVRAAAGAINGDLFADPAGFPVRITQPGSYRLTSNLGGGGSAVLIEINAADVTLDLNGFGLSSALRGIDGVGDNAVVSNGAISGMTGFGMWLTGAGARVSRIRAIGNGFEGIVLSGAGSSVFDSLAIGNGGGINVSNGTVHGCVAQSNSSAGISTSSTGSVPALVVSESAALGNLFGVRIENGAVVRNLVVGNTNTGLQFFTAPPGFFRNGFGRNVLSGNGKTWNGFGLETSQNVCNGSTACPSM